MTSPQAKTRPDTPMMRQYYELKDQYEDEILFFRLGDFYEMFDKDAVLASRELEITLTGRGKDENRIPMCGVPYHAAEGYIHKLVNKGYKVAICEQTEAPVDGVGISKREVVQVLTPGTLMGGDDDQNTRLLAAIYGPAKDKSYGLAVLDMSTGYCATLQCEDKEALDLAVGRFQVSEWLVPFGSRFDETGRGDSASGPSTSSGTYTTEGPSTGSGTYNHQVPELVEGPGGSANANGDTPKTRTTPPTSFTPNSGTTQHYTPLDADHAESELKTFFGVKDLRAFDIGEWTTTFPAIFALIDYARRMQQHDCAQIKHIHPIRNQHHMVMDEVTIRHLELIASSDPKAPNLSLFSTLNYCKTSIGRRRLKQLMLSPFSDVATITKRLDAVDALRQDIIAREELRELLSQVADLERLIARIVSNMNNPRDMHALRHSLTMLRELDGICQPLSSEIWESYSQFFAQFNADGSPYQDCLTVLSQALNDEVPAVIRDGGFIRAGYNAELDELLQSFKDVREWVANLEQVEKEKTGIKSLKVRFNKVFGYYIEVSNSYQNQVPDHYVRKQTLANAERYITTELKEKEQLLLSGEDRQKALEIKLYQELVAACQQWVAPIQELAKIIGDIDCLQSLGHVAQKFRYCRPEFDTESEHTIELVESRHPVLERFSGQSFIANTIQMGEDNRFALITGPNMAGKSTVMRQVALTVIMAQMGAFVPARSAKLSVVDKCFTRIGASDNLSAGQSTFMVEMIETARILNNATPQSLLILDEIGRGTSTFDGISIAAAVSSYIVESIGARTFFATHYHELTEMSDKFPTCQNYSMSISEQDDRLVFKYQLVQGPADKSYGLIVAQMAGLPQPVLDAAAKTLRHLETHAVNGLTPNANGNQLSLF